MLHSFKVLRTFSHTRMPDELDCKVDEAYLVPKNRSDVVRLLFMIVLFHLCSVSKRVVDTNMPVYRNYHQLLHS